VGDPTNAQPAIELVGLVRRYGEVVALDGVDLAVAAGGCFGLLGPNGAGKTTAVAILATLLRPTAGTARLLGRDVVREAEAVRRDVGIVFQEPCLDPELTPRETLDLTARLHHLEAPARLAAEMLERVGLVPEADRPARALSGGQRRRLELGRGLLHRPRVLFLDEPTQGLDVAARANVWEYLRALQREAGTTVFLTTHSMEEADRLCERLAILDRGRIAAEGSPEALKAALGGDAVRVVLEHEAAAAALLSAVEGVRAVVREAPGRFRVTVADGPRRLAALLDAVRPLGVIEVDLRRPSLESVFLHHTGHAFEPDAPGAAAGA
jgi:ABC-2 type transport system ATP-binding protein